MSLDATETRLVSHVESAVDVWLGWASQLVAIPTVSPYAGDDDAGGEAAGQEWLAERLAAMGARVRRIPVPPDVYEKAGMRVVRGRSWDNRENVVGEWDFGGDGPTLLLNSHMDTVGVADMEIPPFDPAPCGGRIHGRGSSDTKGNLAMGLAAVDALLAAGGGLRGRLVFESVVDEECGGAGAGTLACCQAGVTGDLAIVLDGSRGLIASGCNGCATARLIVHGQSGHSSAGTSVSAIDKGFAVKQAVDAFAAHYSRLHPACRGSVRIFRAGRVPSVVPNHAELWINLTYDLSEARERERTDGRWDGVLFMRQLEEKLRSLADADPWFRKKPVDVDWIYDLTPYADDPDGALPRLALKACEDTGDLPATIGTGPAWFDAANLARQLRVPVIGMGHGIAGVAHSANEYVEVAGLVAGAKALTVVLARLLRPGDLAKGFEKSAVRMAHASWLQQIKG